MDNQSVSNLEKTMKFPLIQPSLVKLTQLTQFDKTSHAW